MLVFSLRRGEAFYVGDQRVQLIDFDGQKAVLKTLGQQFDCSGVHVKLPGQEGVVVTSGRRLSHAIGICISAPLDIKILRERLYLKAQEGVLPDRPRRPNRHYAKAMGCRCRGIMKLKMHDGVWVDCPAAQDQALPICYPIE